MKFTTFGTSWKNPCGYPMKKSTSARPGKNVSDARAVVT